MKQTPTGMPAASVGLNSEHAHNDNVNMLMCSICGIVLVGKLTNRQTNQSVLNMHLHRLLSLLCFQVGFVDVPLSRLKLLVAGMFFHHTALVLFSRPLKCLFGAQVVWALESLLILLTSDGIRSFGRS